MKNLKSSLVLSLGLLFINPYAVVAEENSKSQNQSESVDGKGTKFTREGSTEKITDSSGTVRTVSEDANTKDPKGVMNKTTETKHTYSEVKANGESFKNENSVNAAGTSTDYSAEVKVDKNSVGGKTTTITSKEAVNPKGLMNQQSAEVKKEVERDAKGSVVSETITKKIDGETVVDTKVLTK